MTRQILFGFGYYGKGLDIYIGLIHLEFFFGKIFKVEDMENEDA
jgi:hypothetical protein